MAQRVYRQSTTPLTLTAKDRDVLVISSVADLVVNLPKVNKPLAGARVRVVSLTVSAGTGVSVSPDSSDKIQGQLAAGAITAADDKDIINTAATDVAGDALELECDGVDGWVVTNFIGTWARQA